MKTSGGSPCISTLNDIDDIGNSGRKTIEERNLVNADGQWPGIPAHSAKVALFDEQIRLTAPRIEGGPYYAETADGRRLSWRAGVGEALPRFATYDEDEYAVYWGDKAPAKIQRATS